jgi:hypothetical protein
MSLQPVNQTQVGVVRAADADLAPAVLSLATWAQEADAAYQLAQRLTDTSFCPQQFRGKPAEAAAAMLAGSEVGLSPMASLRSFDVIQGQAAPRALTLRAIAQSHGCEFVTVSETSTKVEMRGRRRGGEWESVTWTMERARGLGLVGKDNWKKQPQAMLVARATAELARRIAADALLGIPYAVEEIDEPDVPATGTRTVARATMEQPAAGQSPVSPSPAPQARARKTAASLPDGPPLPGEDDGDPEPAPPTPAPVAPPAPEAPRGPDVAEDSAGVTNPQLRLLNVLCNEQGLKDRNARLDYVGRVLGRPVGSAKEMTKEEASRVIEALQQPAEDATFDDDAHDDTLPLPGEG